MQATYTITALYQDAEIGFGEGDSYEYAMRECLESVPNIYPAEDVVLEAKNSAMPHLIVKTPMDLAQSVFN
jgi:hypothetical protein